MCLHAATAEPCVRSCEFGFRATTNSTRVSNARRLWRQNGGRVIDKVWCGRRRSVEKRSDIVTEAEITEPKRHGLSAAKPSPVCISF